jgi:demethylmenaquinone methyltransferase/2-methoxy-6-polyprenyl-1,4-benzoquinol methylase
MGNEYYESGPRRAAQVNRLFAAIASRYDLINDVQSFGLHRLWKRRLVRLAELRPGDTGLDVCCGTGDIAFALAAAGGGVQGLDFSPEMLEVARRRAQNSAGSPKPTFLQGDAMQLPFPDASFDVVTVGYGLRNLARWEDGLREMVRVARVGGRLLVLDFGKPDNRCWRTLYFAYLRLLVPVFGLIFCGNPGAYAYIIESLEHYPAQRGVAAEMRTLGLNDVRIVNLLGGAMSINYGVKPLKQTL